MARSPEEWRQRFAGRTAFDRAAAEKAIVRAYRASGLTGPDRILWADGPNDAADRLRLLLRLPRTQRRVACLLIVMGAALWFGLALAAVAPERAEQPFGAVVLVGSVLSFYLARASMRRLPASPNAGQAGSRLDLLLSGALMMLVMIGVLIAIRELDRQPGSVSHGIVLAVSAVVGMLPGTVLLLRLWRTYSTLPDSLAQLAPGRSVARALARSRPRSRTRIRAGTRPDESLLLAYDSAYAGAFGRSDDLLLDAGIRPASPGMQVAMWVPPESEHRRNPAPLWLVPVHFDGIAAAESASAAEQEGAVGSEAYADLAFHVDRLFPFRAVALAVRPPANLSLDADGRPHAEGGPALAWSDGTEVYAWRGRVVDRALVDESSALTLARINRERDRERRSVLIERYGLGRFVTESAAANIQVDECGALYRLEQPGEPLVAVRVVNSTAEPDGSFREFWLRVPPTIRTAREAVAWTFGLTADEYEPATQS